MKIILKKMKLFGFLSYGEAEVDFRDKGYCLLTGVNKNPKDSAKSNGSGKSSLSSAICWALTGETIQGLKTNIPNIFLDQGCYVRLEFDIDADSYVVTRYKDYDKIGTDLKIELNGKDISGKGIRESQEVLAQYLPDLTSQLIASVIILGQGLPNKFSANSPSGRKEVLEKLSKSDFMIQDIKNRIEKRNGQLFGKIRSVEDKMLEANTKINLYNQQITTHTNELAELNKPVDFDSLIDESSKKLVKLNEELKQLETSLKTTNDLLTEVQEKLLVESKAKDAKLEEYRKGHEYNQKDLLDRRSTLNSKKYTLEAEIKRIESITDICPTCGQKIPNIVKPDTSAQKVELNNIVEELKLINQDLLDDDNTYSAATRKLNESFTAKTQELVNEKNKLSSEVTRLNSEFRIKNSEISTETTNLNQIKLNKANHEEAILKAKKAIDDCNAKIIGEKNLLAEFDAEKTSLKDHLDVITKMNTFVKRDFRGFLLQNIITFIDKKAKEYSEVVFKTRDLDFALDGNNICITYCGKAFENLSGGEQQRVDLILQFALRDMMSQYLGFSSNVLFLDELFDALDAQGCDAILDLISQKINDVESIFIISHRSSDLGIPCDSEIIIEKNENGVSSIK